MAGTIKLLFLTSAFCLIYLVLMMLVKSTFLQNCSKAFLEFNETSERYLRTAFNVMSKCGLTQIDNTYNKFELQHGLNCSIPRRYLKVPKPLIALASFPGSGNTWTRILIETATGVYTGSVYSNERVFPGSKTCPARGKVVIVKTHRTDDSVKTNNDCLQMNITRLNFSSVIYLIRNPYNALLADFNRQHTITKYKNTNHLPKMSTAPRQMFGTAAWHTFALNKAKSWRKMTLYWMRKKDVPVFVLVYEKLIVNVTLEVLNLAKFFNNGLEFKHMHCLSSTITESRKRIKPKWLSKENQFSNELREHINGIIKYVKANLGSNSNISSILSILDTYILPTSQTN